MYIDPNTTIKLLRNVPLDNTYKNTLFFSNADAQTNYFASLNPQNFANYTYQRVNKGVCNVGIKADSIYNCNYMMFQNSNHGTKWFYAFITSVEYVNETVSQITFEIDVMQTWLFDFTLKHSFVEREHSVTDSIGDNIVAENLTTGEYMYDDYQAIDQDFTDLGIVVGVSDTDVSTGNKYDGVFSGLTLYFFNPNNSLDELTAFGELIMYYADHPDSIVMMYMCPSKLISGVDNDYKIVNQSTARQYNYVMDSAWSKPAFGGYTPKNKKMYTYPYQYFHVDNGAGHSLCLRYEFFEALTPVLHVAGTMTPPVKVICLPCSYKGVPDHSELGGYTELTNESITLESFPQCMWVTDAFTAWFAQNSVPMLLNTLVGVGASVAMANPLPIASSVAGSLSGVYQASMRADISKGSLSNGSVNTARLKNNFNKARVRVTEQYAKVIDEYFTMFGYQTNRVKVPNISARPYFNYVKTIDCVVVGSVPADDIKKICSIHDKGVTYWKNGANVGNYSLNNSI